MKVTFRMCADDGDRFAPGAFDGQIGKVIPILADGGASQALLIAAKVADDGTSAELTVDGDLRLPEEPVSGFSIGRASR